MHSSTNEERFFASLRTTGMGDAQNDGGYVNVLMDEGKDRIAANYRDNFPRLTALKRQWDPSNLFHMNQNIRPET
jgi:hypothetical protein